MNDTHGSPELRSRPGAAPIERPASVTAPTAMFGSDAVAEALRALDVPYIALNPGASFRGFHDSLVNYLGNERPQMLLCLHEEHAVAIAHGYAKVTGRAMAAAAHSNVGLMHATMALFNAWCDRMPLVLIGATGPIDASERRPWIEWIHTARDQGALVRDYTKWDDQPASPAAAREAILRAGWIAQTAPKGPVYINLDVGLQEAPLAAPLPPIDVRRYMPAVAASASAEQIEAVAALLARAERPLMLVGRVSRDKAAWDARIRLAETFNAQVVTDLKVGAGFPTNHPLHAGAPGIYAVPEAREAIARADVILSLDWTDLAGTLVAAFGRRRARRDDHPGLAGSCVAQRLEHGPSGPAGSRRVVVRRSRSGCAATGRRARQVRAQREGLRIRVRIDAEARVRRAGARRRSDHDGASLDGPARGGEGTRRFVRAPAARLGRQALGLLPSARLSGLRRRRRRGRRPRHLGRRRARVEGQRASADLHRRRRRLPDGRDGDLDGRSLSDSAPLHRRQQPVVLQR